MQRLFSHVGPSFALLALALGCGESQTSSSPGAPGPLSIALTSWQSGDKDAAVESLLAVNWNSPDLAAGESALSLSEEELVNLPSSDNRQVQEDVVKVLVPLRDLGKHAISLGNAAQASGDDQLAQKYYETAMHLGKALSDEKRMLAIQSVGKAIVAMTEEVLASP